MHRLSYRPDTSILHRLYPLTKLVWLILGTLLIFFLMKSVLLLIIAGFCLLILLLIYPGIWHLRGFRFVFMTGLFLFVLYLLFEKSGQVLFNPGVNILTITTNGLDLGLRYSSRFLSIVFLSYIFILTTSPNDLAYAIMKAGVPYRFGFMLVTALRLSPILEDEGQIIYQAQLVRGVRYDRSSFKKFFLLVRQFLTPLLISALRRVDKLVFSFEGRGFGKYPTRTFRNQTSLSKLDLFISIGLSLCFTTLILINYGVIL